MFKCQNKLNLKMYCGFKIHRNPYWDRRKKSQFQHYTSIFSFVKNTKLQLYESIMQNLNEDYLVIKFNTAHTHTHTHTHTLYVQTKRYVEESMFN